MIISISGKKGSGKDTAGTIIQFLIDQLGPIMLGEIQIDENTLKDCLALITRKEKLNYPENTNWKIVKFSDKLKDIVCMLIGCTREQLEDNDFKETPLREEWDKWVIWNRVGYKEYFSTEKEALKSFQLFSPGNINMNKITMTPRLFLQLLGTDCGRKIIHPDIWVNATMVDYKPDESVSAQQHSDGDWYADEHGLINVTPNWVITDVRFLNEVRAVKDRGGLNIRINKKTDSVDGHESETALDNYDKFDEVIENDESLMDLVLKIQAILVKHKIITNDDKH